MNVTMGVMSNYPSLSVSDAGAAAGATFFLLRRFFPLRRPPLMICLPIACTVSVVQGASFVA
jgi:hypothetical protein